jgi:4-hydroxy 2-oxovalerate aldolase|tara:strand:+ start:1072 stop:2079 length:1008 start_codon:yes stop_codon:yes gene_type:complete
MSKISLLDCTLRDGGHVNNFDFGFENIKKTILNLMKANVDIIEIGFLKNEQYKKDRTIFEIIDQVEEIYDKNDSNSKISIMIRPDWYSIEKLTPSSLVDIVRFAFYKEDLALALMQAKRARELGYKVFLNPVNVTGYKKEELEEILDEISDFSPDGVSVVDTFGSLTEKKMLPILEIFQKKLKEDVTIGLHLHENLALSFSLAQKFLELKSANREVVIDSSVMGMGRIPGNLPTELLMQYLNDEFGKSYQIHNVLDLVSSPISQIKNKITWGYSPEYAFSAFLEIHRSYPEYLINNLNLSQDKAFSIMKSISETGEGGKFSKSLADKILEDKLNI